MKKIYYPFLFVSLIIYVFLLILINSLTISRDFYLGKKTYYFHEHNLTGKDIDFNFLLNIEKGVVVVHYSDGNKGVYDPENKIDTYFNDYSDSNDEKYYSTRYFNREDYLNKTPYFIRYATDILENGDYENDKDNMIQIHYNFSDDYKIYNLFYYDKEIEKITVFHDDGRILNGLKSQGAKEIGNSHYSFRELFQLSNMSIYSVVMVGFLIVGFLFSVFSYILGFSYLKRTIKIHILTGLSFKKFMYRYFSTFAFKLLLGIGILHSLFMLLKDYVFIPNRTILQLSFSVWLVYISIYFIFASFTFLKLEKTYEIY